jgi:hypothetical protein
MAPEASSGAEALEILGCIVAGAGDWSIRMEEGSGFEVGEDGALE